MRYRLTADVEGLLFIASGRSVTSEADGIRYELLANEKGQAVQAAVSTTVPEDRTANISTTITPPPPGTAYAAHLHIRVDSEVHDRLIDALQRLESTLAIGMNGKQIRRILWSAPSQEFIPENTEEEEQLQIAQFRRKEEHVQIPHFIDQDSFHDRVQGAPRHESLRMATAFWREAMNDFDDFRYVQAFYNFFFVIEDLFANRKTGEKQVLRAFAQSDEFCEAVKRALDSFPEANTSNMALLKPFFGREGCDWSVAGAQKFLYRMRGNLHHFFSDSTRLHATPFNQRHFRPVTLFTMHVVNLVIFMRIVRFNQAQRAANENE